MDLVKSGANIKTIDKYGIRFTDGYELLWENCGENCGESCNSGIKCVADRDITSVPPYFAFYTSPGIKVVFDSKGFLSQSKNIKSFHKLQKRIQELGFTTRDLS